MNDEREINALVLDLLLFDIQLIAFVVWASGERMTGENMTLVTCPFLPCYVSRKLKTALRIKHTTYNG